MALQTRDKILKEGFVRHRQSAIGLQKWRPRHLVFKVTHAGRLQLIVHKDSPATAANEIKEIAIDEFGGLEQNLRMDSEKYVFAIITTNITECFSTEFPQDLTDWRQLLQEYLGKELVVSITIPAKQHLLKAGKASLRIRNTGFTITTCDNPPRCQGTWHIIHIRKYGGTDMFRFQTGSKCPTGEYLYSIESKDNLGIKNLFSDLSNHRPIFADDRLGRRMTLEGNFHSTTPNSNHSPSRAGNNRLSLQAANRSSDKHLYENREQFQTLHGHHSSSDLSVPGYNSDVRRASLDDVLLEPLNTEGGKHGTPSRNQDDDKLYQNIHPSTPHSRASPTKRSHFSPVSVPVPEGFYTLTPPTLVRRHNNSNNVSPSSSPEESSLSLFSVPSDGNSDHELSMAIVGGNKSAHPLSKTLSPPSDGIDIGGMYQNVEFMSQGHRRNVSEASASDEIAPIIPATITEEPLNPHNYTNVAFAQATAKGQATAQGKQKSSAKHIKSKKSKMNNLLHKTRSSGFGCGDQQNRVERRVSTPVKSTSRHSPIQSTPMQRLVVSTSSDDLLSPSPSSVPRSTPVLRNSHSNMELNSSSRENKSLDYYNYCAPTLPAHSNTSNKSLSLRNKLTLSSSHRVIQFSDTLQNHKSAEILSPDSPHAAKYSKLSKRRLTGSDTDSDITSPAYASVDDLKLKAAPHGADKLMHRSSSCDCLDMREPTSQEALVNGRPDSHNAMYDTLTPLRDAINANFSIYDSLGPCKEDLMSGSSSPDPSDDHYFDPSDLKATYLRRTHKYEYIDVDLESDKSVSTSPTGMEHPLDWTRSLPVGFVLRERASGIKETKTLPRRKQLPLQESGGEQSSSETEYSTLKRVKPPRLSRENSVETLHSKVKPSSTHFNSVSQTRLSADSTEVSSSSDSTKRESVLSNGSTSSAELVNNTALDRDSNSPSHRITHEDVAFTTKITHIESPEDEANSQPPSPSHGPPPIPKRGLTESSMPEDESKKAPSGSPPLPPRSQEQPMFSVPLPRAQFDFKPSPPPPPKMLCPPPDLSYAAVFFSNGETPVFSHIDPVNRSNRSSVKNSQTHSDGLYATIDHVVTAGLQRTSEQVADHQREFLETKI